MAISPGNHAGPISGPAWRETPDLPEDERGKCDSAAPVSASLTFIASPNRF